jgi:hypothetical protein
MLYSTRPSLGAVTSTTPWYASNSGGVLPKPGYTNSASNIFEPLSFFPGLTTDWQLIGSGNTMLNFLLPDGSQVIYTLTQSQVPRGPITFSISNIQTIPAPPAAPPPPVPPPPPPANPYPITNGNFDVTNYHVEVQDNYTNQEIEGFYYSWINTPVVTSSTYSYQVGLLNTQIATRGLNLTPLPVYVAPAPPPPSPTALTGGNFALTNWNPSLAGQYSDTEIQGFYLSYTAAISDYGGISNPANPSPDIYLDLNAQINSRNLQLIPIPDCPDGYGRIRPRNNPASGYGFAFQGDSGFAYFQIPPSASAHFFAVNTTQIPTGSGDINHVSDVQDLNTGDHYGYQWSEVGGSGSFLGISGNTWKPIYTDAGYVVLAVAAVVTGTGIVDALATGTTAGASTAAAAFPTAIDAGSSTALLPATAEMTAESAAGSTLLPASLSVVTPIATLPTAAVIPAASVLTGTDTATFTVPSDTTMAATTSVAPSAAAATPVGTSTIAATGASVAGAAGKAVSASILSVAATALSTEIKKITGQLPGAVKPTATTVTVPGTDTSVAGAPSTTNPILKWALAGVAGLAILKNKSS